MKTLTEFTILQKLKAAEKQLDIIDELLNKVDYNLEQKVKKAA